MADLTIREIYERHRNGDANTTPDLIKAATHFEQLAWRAAEAGPVFRLAANEAYQVARAMRDFISARCCGNSLANDAEKTGKSPLESKAEIRAKGMETP